MSNPSILAVFEAEEQAGKLVEEAKKEAAALRQRTKEEMEQLSASLSEKTREEIAVKSLEAKEAADRRAAPILKEAKVSAESMLHVSKESMDAAVAQILERMLE